MRSYASNILQLYRQIQQGGYSSAEMSGIRDAYELAMSVFSGRFQPSGKVFIAHVVRTASILASLRLPGQVVAAGLIHNVYGSGDFGDGRIGMTEPKRQEVRRAVGGAVEEYVARFTTMPWDIRAMDPSPDVRDKLGSIDRNVVLIRLADHLDHLLDLDVLYRSELSRRRYLDKTELAVRWAETLGLPALAAELEQALTDAHRVPLPVRLHENRDNWVVFVPPKSYRKRWLVVYRQDLVPRFCRLRSAIAVRRRARHLAGWCHGSIRFMKRALFF